MENMTNFEKYGNVMIDLETLSTHKNASIIEIGAVEFNKHTGETGKVFNALIKPSEWAKNDRHVDGNTVAWWFKQKEEARERFFTENENIRCTDLKTALNALFYFIMDCDTVDNGKNVTVWGNGSSFDIAILESAYEYFDIRTPWEYSAINDVRTIVALNPTIKQNMVYETGVKHNAVNDCMHEINYLVETLKSLNVKYF